MDTRYYRYNDSATIYTYSCTASIGYVQSAFLMYTHVEIVTKMCFTR